MAVNTTRFSLRGTQARSSTARRAQQQSSDDEILGLVTSVAQPVTNSSGEAREGTAAAATPLSQARTAASEQHNNAETDFDAQKTTAQAVISPELAQVLNAHPQLREAWDAAQEFRSVFGTPAAAQDAKDQLDELDSMFFSQKPEAQAALAARIHDLSPSAFQALAQAMQVHASKLSERDSGSTQPTAPAVDPADASASATASSPADAAPVGTAAAPSSQARAAGALAQMPSPAAAAENAPTPTVDPKRAAQAAFFHSTNSAAVHQVLAAIETQVNRLLPAGVSGPTKTRIVGEIYRDLGSALGANRQLGHQLREVFRSGAGDAAHQQAIVSLVTGRARQALPAIARRVINEWTHGVVAANHEKLSRHEGAAKRVDISGTGSSDGVNRKPTSPRDVDYKRLSDADILNL